MNPPIICDLSSTQRITRRLRSRSLSSTTPPLFFHRRLNHPSLYRRFSSTVGRIERFFWPSFNLFMIHVSGLCALLDVSGLCKMLEPNRERFNRGCNWILT